MKIMSVFAHPADHFAEAGGTLAIHAERGDDVVLVTITHGGRIHPVKYRAGEGAEDTRQAVIEHKKEEMRRAAECIGVKRMINLDYDDNYIGVQPEIVMKLAEILAEERPDVVITDYPLTAMDADTHTVASMMFFNAVLQVGLFLDNMDDGKSLKNKEKKSFSLKQIYMTKVPVYVRDPFATNGLRNDVYVDITPVVGKKVKAMDQFASQGYRGDYARKAIECVDGHHGKIAYVNFAEGFCRYSPETHSCLPLVEQEFTYGDRGSSHMAYSAIDLRATYPLEED